MRERGGLEKSISIDVEANCFHLKKIGSGQCRGRCVGEKEGEKARDFNNSLNRGCMGPGAFAKFGRKSGRVGGGKVKRAVVRCGGRNHSKHEVPFHKLTGEKGEKKNERSLATESG